MIEGYHSLLSIEDMKNEVTKMISEFEQTYRSILTLIRFMKMSNLK